MANDPSHGEISGYRRRRVLRALRIYFNERRWPRVIMSAIMLFTGAAGFVASYLLLRAGVELMWVRYPLAVFIAWAVFLVQIRMWAEMERAYFQPGENLDALLLHPDPADERRRYEDNTSSTPWDWIPSWDAAACGGDDETGCLGGIVFLVLTVILVIVLWTVLSVVAAAPILIAEVFLDAVLLAALYKRLKGMEHGWWLAGAIRHTIVPVIITAIMLAVAGYVMRSAAPEARSVGGFWQHMQSQRGK